jgi:hypothetical protein
MSSPIVYSIYIPRIFVSFTEEMIAYHFHTIQFGRVKRVDFAPIVDEKSGEERKDIQKCFVHLSDVYRSQMSMSILDEVENENGSFKLAINEKYFWWLLKNKNPVEETKMNIHQIAENTRLLSERLEKQEKMIAEQAEKIVFLEKKLGSQSPKVVYKLQNPEKIISKETVDARILNSEDLCGNK